MIFVALGEHWANQNGLKFPNIARWIQHVQGIGGLRVNFTAPLLGFCKINDAGLKSVCLKASSFLTKKMC